MPAPVEGPQNGLVVLTLPLHIARSLLNAMGSGRPPTEQVAAAVASAIVDGLNVPPPHGPPGPTGTRGAPWSSFQ
jgi:hypothetical protein